MLTKEVILGAVRHLMTGLGVFAIAGGYAEDTEKWTVFASEFVGVLGFMWSVMRKYQRQQRS